MSVRWRPSCRTHIRSLFSKSCIARSNIFLRQSCDFLTNGKFQLFMTDPVVLNASTHRSIVFRSGIAPRRSTLNFRRKRRWTVTTESLFLKKTARRQTHDALMFQCAMATETALSELSAGSRPTSSPLPSNSHFKNMRFLCSTLYNDKLQEYKRNWIHHVNRIPRNRSPRVMKQYFPTGRRNHGRPLKRLLDA